MEWTNTNCGGNPSNQEEYALAVRVAGNAVSWTIFKSSFGKITCVKSIEACIDSHRLGEARTVSADACEEPCGKV
jgi:hypothetical protein